MGLRGGEALVVGILDLIVPHFEVGVDGAQDIGPHDHDRENDDGNDQGVFDQALALAPIVHVKSIYHM